MNALLNTTLGENKAFIYKAFIWKNEFIKETFPLNCERRRKELPNQKKKVNSLFYKCGISEMTHLLLWHKHAFSVTSFPYYFVLYAPLQDTENKLENMENKPYVSKCKVLNSEPSATPPAATLGQDICSERTIFLQLCEQAVILTPLLSSPTKSKAATPLQAPPSGQAAAHTAQLPPQSHCFCPFQRPSPQQKQMRKSPSRDDFWASVVYYFSV